MSKSEYIDTVVLDAGHGGTDAGAVNGNHYEKDKTLKITKEVGSLLEGQCINVVYTRTSDTYVSLDQRTSIENKAKASCCVSLHLDAGAKIASGMTVWLHSKAPVDYGIWGQKMLLALKSVGYKTDRYTEINKGYRGNPLVDYAWNRNTKSPSMLLELGFITNEDNLKDFDAKYKEYAVAIAKTICEFIGVEYIENSKLDTTPPKTFYRIQVGAFGSKLNAQNYLSQVKAKGYSGSFLVEPTTDNLYRVQVGSFSVKANAEKFMKEVQSKGMTAIIKEYT